VTYARSSLTLETNNKSMDPGVIAAGHIGEAELEEAGLKATLFDDRLYFAAAVYEQTRSDVRVQDDPALGAEVSSSITKGWETEVKWAPTRNLVLPAGLSEYRTRQGNPERRFGLNANYERDNDLGFTLSGNRLSSTYSGRLKLIELPAATIVDAGAFFDWRNTRVNLDLFNLTDERCFRARSGGTPGVAAAWTGGFRLEEATIADVHGAIRSGAITCRGLVEAYVARAKAYNGMRTALVTADGKPFKAALGAVRAGARVKHPTKTVAAADVFPEFARYQGRPVEFGRMEPTASDATVMQQFGLRVGIPNAGQLNALETLNLRGDVNYAYDPARRDSPDIADLRAKGAIIYANANANANATAAPTGLDRSAGPNHPETWKPGGNYAYAAWDGQACNPYDTERVPRGTSSGSGVSVAANLVMCSICAQCSASCEGPASRNNVVNLLNTRRLMMHGGINGRRAGDRAGIRCRTTEDVAKVLDAVQGFHGDDTWTAIPPELSPERPFASFVVKREDVAAKPLKGMRVGVVRDQLGAELVESHDPMYPDDPDVPNLRYTCQDAFREILAHNVPEYFWQTRNGELEFAVPGWDVRTVDYAIALAMGKAPLSPNVNLRRISAGLDNFKSPFTVNKYLAERGDRRVKDWAAYVANAKFEDGESTAWSKNAIGWQDMRPADTLMSYLEMSRVMQLVVQKVMYENDIDVFVNPENTLLPPKIGGPTEPVVSNRPAQSCCAQFTALFGGPEIDVPAGYTTVEYAPQYRLSEDGKRYTSVAGEVETKLPYPMPLSLMFWAGPGHDGPVIKVGSAYEAATWHRKPPPMFGPVKGEPR
jgi:Asp-tRNA(Asn)/Glu-tRNA(Gln) amidotransferase A subunit family amidase